MSHVDRICNEVWTLGVWGELAFFITHRPSSQGWAPGVVCVYVHVRVAIILYLGGGFVCGGLAGKWGGGALGCIAALVNSRARPACTYTSPLEGASTLRKGVQKLARRACTSVTYTSALLSVYGGCQHVCAG